MGSEAFAAVEASYLPGGVGENLRALMRLRARRIARLQSAGLCRREIREATGWTERQQRYALKVARREA